MPYACGRVVLVETRSASLEGDRDLVAHVRLGGDHAHDVVLCDVELAAIEPEPVRQMSELDAVIQSVDVQMGGGIRALEADLESAPDLAPDEIIDRRPRGSDPGEGRGLAALHDHSAGNLYGQCVGARRDHGHPD